MPEVRIKLSPEQNAYIKARAEQHRMTVSAYARWLLLDSTAPMTEAELQLLIAEKARAGNIRAMEILARRTPVPTEGGAGVGVTPGVEEEPANGSSSALDQLRSRRAAA